MFADAILLQAANIGSLQITPGVMEKSVHICNVTQLEKWLFAINVRNSAARWGPAATCSYVAFDWLAASSTTPFTTGTGNW